MPNEKTIFFYVKYHFFYQCSSSPMQVPARGGVKIFEIFDEKIRRGGNRFSPRWISCRSRAERVWEVAQTMPRRTVEGGRRGEIILRASVRDESQ